jgi:peptidoglycan/xylan/chitin deacetylase (PgdA/CDA1 family)
VTADVHHMSLKTKDQRLLRDETTEIDCLIRYLEILKRNKLKATIFATGKVVTEEAEKIIKLFDPRLVEIGGHTYSAFRPKIIYGLASRVLKLSNGPKFIQKWDIGLTARVIKQHLGIRIRSWRNHAYRHDRNTYGLLGKQGIEFVSDMIRTSEFSPIEYIDGIQSIAINTTPDHENLPHSGANPALSVTEWANRIMEEVPQNISYKRVAVILAHPTCMYVEDNFETFEKLCSFLNKYPSYFLSEVPSISI